MARSSIRFQRFALFTFFFICTSANNVDIHSFGIITDHIPDEPISTTMTLYWQRSIFECTILASESNHLYECNVNELHSSQKQQYQTSNKLQIESTEVLSIKSIIIMDSNNNRHTIDIFCTSDLVSDCLDILSVSSTTVQLPTTSIFIQSPNQSHEGFIEQQSVFLRFILILAHNVHIYTQKPITRTEDWLMWTQEVHQQILII